MILGVRPRFLFLISLVLWLALPRTAQADDTSAARALATEGVSAFDEGKYERAIELFEKAEKHYHANVHRFMIARAYVKLGQLVQAREALYSVVKEDLPEKASKTFVRTKEEAADLLAEIEPKIAKLVLKITPTDAEVSVSVDDKEVPSDLIGIARPTNPGTRTVTVSAPGYETQTIEIALEEGEQKEVALELLPSESPRDDGILAPKARDAQPEEGGPNLRPWSIAAFAAGIVGVGVGATFFLLSNKDKNAAEGILDGDCTSASDGRYLCTSDQAAEVETLDEATARKQTLSVVGVSVGGALLVTGAVLWILDGGRVPTSTESARADRKWQPHVTPLLGGGSLGFSRQF